ncbi:serine/threonine-protein kinase/endoribonuclease IRE1-like isoform X2 [Daphnia pulicaria]|uniref:serine/threonine-protein kinase/endoribonuclease IRE1-like isoform X2 n=1 Tax=Daphnia pulicaria TaxID=35523 RepID=UPI001EEB2A1B|nr:serine/threonine-protein kinase/endoribonuclease IRE1-like isoform X2 [Daphnia pulicaria]
MANAVTPVSNRFPHQIQFDRKKVLGEGNSSVVYKGSYENQNVAVKRIVLNPSINGDDENFEARMKLDHENVLKLLAVEEDRDFRYFVLELCDASLSQFFEKKYNGPQLPPDGEVMYQIADGLEYIHSQKLAHRNIKPENILISTKSQMKLADFGLSQKIESKCYVTGPKGVLLWKAPEQFQADREDIEIEIAQKSDVFSCGCVFFVFLMRKNDGMHPFGDLVDHLQIYANIQKGNSININKAKDNHPLEGELIQKMIQRDPIKRKTSKDVKYEIEVMLPKLN